MSSLWKARGAEVCYPSYLQLCRGPHHCLPDIQATPVFRAQCELRQKQAPEQTQMSEAQCSQVLLSPFHSQWEAGSQAAPLKPTQGGARADCEGKHLGTGACMRRPRTTTSGSLGTTYLLIGTASLARAGPSLSVPFVLQLCSDHIWYLKYLKQHILHD